MDFARKFLVIAILTAVGILPVFSVLVEVEQGTLRGETVTFVEEKHVNISAKIDVFKGVPFAEKPIRFRPPEPKQKWEGILDALAFTLPCSQYLDPSYYPDPSQQSDDCLYLNVYAPSETTNKLPVMVFIHGGAYIVGTSMSNDASGIPMAAIGNVVVVTVNYRLGAHGFLDTGDEASSGNYGLLDQAEALRWVRRNIGAFGGNSSMVTLFGESAGAGSVDFHVLSKYSRDLFDQAILESGTSTAPWSFADKFEQSKVTEAFKLGRLVNCNSPNTHELVECLRQVDSRTLEETVAVNEIRMGPTIDGVFLEESPVIMTERGDFKHCPMMIGINKDEGTLNILFLFPESYTSSIPPFISKTKFNEMVHNTLETYNNNVTSILEDSVKQEYVDWSKWDTEGHDYFETIVSVSSDQLFGCPATLAARAHASMTSEPLYFYYMTHAPTVSIYSIDGYGPTWMGAGHGEELQFVFGYPFIPEKSGFSSVPEEEKELSVKFIRYWTNFARTGDPSRVTTSSAPGTGEWAWPVFTIPELQYKELSLNMSTGRGLKADQCAYWNNFKPSLQTYLGK
ncbi:Acetylcholinesterase [Holothuria leucospilota]|uniref:Carboxylic ester hydrolase n=1 Tax=Holothuria leucospilota TaxID=206669 RepID=A0A9Q1H8D8_HOLLE|nr:Acetylcholinesterase [Holothuria leucospilota]